LDNRIHISLILTLGKHKTIFYKILFQFSGLPGIQNSLLLDHVRRVSIAIHGKGRESAHKTATVHKKDVFWDSGDILFSGKRM